MATKWEPGQQTRWQIRAEPAECIGYLAVGGEMDRAAEGIGRAVAAVDVHTGTVLQAQLERGWCLQHISLCVCVAPARSICMAALASTVRGHRSQPGGARREDRTENWKHATRAPRAEHRPAADAHTHSRAPPQRTTKNTQTQACNPMDPDMHTPSVNINVRLLCPMILGPPEL